MLLENFRIILFSLEFSFVAVVAPLVVVVVPQRNYWSYSNSSWQRDDSTMRPRAVAAHANADSNAAASADDNCY